MKKILIAEDNEGLLKSIASKLRSSGYQTVEAFDGEVALERLRESKPDLVLLDIVMPKYSGFDVLEVMHSDPSLSDIPVIIISNSGQEVEIDRAKKLGAKDFLIKPEFTPDEVLQKIKDNLKD